MEEKNKTAVLVDEDGVEYELDIIKEFDYNDKKYAVLYEEGLYEEDEAETEEHECECEDDECEECACMDDGHIYVLEIIEDEDGKVEYREISSELMEEIIPVVEKELYPTEE